MFFIFFAKVQNKLQVQNTFILNFFHLPYLIPFFEEETSKNT